MSDSPTRPEAMRVVRLVWVQDETAGRKSLYFEDDLCSRAEPGQYIMIWTPKAEEVPMSLSTINRDGLSSVTVRPIGETTNALCSLEEGDRVGVRGPFGNGFSVIGDSPLLVAGGTGAAPLATLAEKMVSEGLKPAFILGAVDSEQLVFRDRLEELLGNDLLIATDDGSCGFKGFASQLAVELIEERGFDSIHTCGPELMMATIFRDADERGIPVQASLERYMKCAVGLCGSCAVGPYRVCKDGPVLGTEQLRNVSDEFGKVKMDPSGRVIRVDH